MEAKASKPNNKPCGACECGEHAWTATTRGFVAFADAKYLPEIRANAWHVAVRPGDPGMRRGYLRVATGSGVAMANVLLRTSAVLDHIDRDSLNCRGANLRIATPAENSRNHGPKEGRPFKGIFKRRDKWRAAIWVNGSNRYLGTFSEPEDAARAYDKAAMEEFGEFAWLNFSQHQGGTDGV